MAATLESNAFVGRTAIEHGAEWEVLSDPAHPTYSDKVLFVWAQYLRPMVGRQPGKGAKRRNPTVLFLPLRLK